MKTWTLIIDVFLLSINKIIHAFTMNLKRFWCEEIFKNSFYFSRQTECFFVFFFVFCFVFGACVCVCVYVYVCVWGCLKKCESVDENMGKCHIPNEWVSAISFGPHVAKQCHPGHMWLSIAINQNYNQLWTHAKVWMHYTFFFFFRVHD